VCTAQHSIVSQPRRIAGFRRMFRPFSFNCFNSGSIALFLAQLHLFRYYKPLVTLPTQAVTTQFASLQLSKIFTAQLPINSAAVYCIRLGFIATYKTTPFLRAKTISMTQFYFGLDIFD
jgi:hypothetical protein